MAFSSYDPLLGVVDLNAVDTAGPGPFNLTNTNPGAGRQVFMLEVIRGYDGALGGGEFMYAQAGATLTKGAIVQFNGSLSATGNVVNTAVAWTGTANGGDILGVAMVGLTTGQWGWFQVGGNAIANVSGTPTANAPVYWQAAGVVSGTAVAGKQVEGAKFATTNGVTLGAGSTATVLPSTQAVITINRPSSQGQIT